MGQAVFQHPLHLAEFSPVANSSRDTSTTRQLSRGLKIAKESMSSLDFSQATKALWGHLGQHPGLVCRCPPASRLEISNEAPWRILDFPPHGGFPWQPLPAGDPGSQGQCGRHVRPGEDPGPAAQPCLQPPTALVGLSLTQFLLEAPGTATSLLLGRPSPSLCPHLQGISSSSMVILCIGHI